MHLIVPFAAPLSEAGRQALQTLKLPRLEAMVSGLAPTLRDDGDEYALSPPHERAHARALGLAGADGELPWAALQAAEDGLDTGDLAWGLVTPVHWEVAADHIRLADPAALQLAEVESRAYFDALQPLFESEGVLLAWGAPDRWYAAHESLRDLPTASLDRVINRPLDAWLPRAPEARLLRRLQNEAQMLLHTHARNVEREEQGALTLNSFWLSGCGVRQPVRAIKPVIEDRLRQPALAEDWAAWCEAWQALDAGWAAPAARPATLVLCGERSAVQYDTGPRSLWHRLRGTLWGAQAAALLEPL
jgi:hypothetical protein